MRTVKIVNFGPGRAGLATVGYTLFDSTGSVASVRTTTGVYELSAGTGIYAAYVPFEDDFDGSIMWDTSGSNPIYAAEPYNFKMEGPIVSASMGSSSRTTIQASVWDAPTTLYTTASTMGSTINAVTHLSSAIDTIRKIELGTWKITGSQMIFYELDSVTEITRFDLRNERGEIINPYNESPFQRTRS